MLARKDSRHVWYTVENYFFSIFDAIMVTIKMIIN